MNILHDELLKTDEELHLFRDKVMERAVNQIDNYLDVGCYVKPQDVRPHLLIGFSQGYQDAVANLTNLIKSHSLFSITSVDDLLDDIKDSLLGASDLNR